MLPMTTPKIEERRAAGGTTAAAFSANGIGASARAVPLRRGLSSRIHGMNISDSRMPGMTPAMNSWPTELFVIEP